MAKRTKAQLTVHEVRGAKHPGGKSAHRLHDGSGLYLQLTPGGGKSWLLRYRIGDKDTFAGLGECEPAGLSLAAARTKAATFRVKLAAGIDPLVEKELVRLTSIANKATAHTRTFEAVATSYIADQAAGWQNAKHAKQWTATLATYAYPTMGSIEVAEIRLSDVEAVLRPIWASKAETADRLRGRIETILNHAKARGLRTGDNPAAKNLLDQLLPRRLRLRGHHGALPWSEIAAFRDALHKQSGQGARALEFVIFTWARSGEVRGMIWDEVDIPGRVWTVPAGRMKARREHRVPLSDRALEVLAVQAKAGTVGLVFPAARGKPLSDMTLTALLRRMQPSDGPLKWADGETGRAITAHGFRATARTWLDEATEFPSAVAEAALAHAQSDKTVAAYARGTLFEKRVELMSEWADFVYGM